MVIDVLSAIIISLGLYLGYKRGLIKTIFDTLSLIIGIVAALKISPIVIDFLQNLLKINPAITFILGIAVTFIGVMVTIRFIGKKLEELLEVVHLNIINKSAGAALQGFFFATILALSIGLVDKVKLVSDQTKASSFTYPYLVQVPAVSQQALNKLKPVFSTFWEKTLETIDEIKKKDSSEG
ncbi:MAG TPA: CvpA family protein [Saprospiraceae bacterium]|nr:CvpA family protein [Saprospiraceae bacterium]